MSYFSDYEIYATRNEAPHMFHVWGAYVALSAVVQRRIWFPFGRKFIYSNIFVTLVGDAGNGKSTAFDKVGGVLAHFPEVPISASIETSQATLNIMIGNKDLKQKSAIAVEGPTPRGPGLIHPMVIMANEFINFIALDPHGWINILNEVYDREVYRYRTMNFGDRVMENPYFVVLANLTTSVATELQKQNILNTGYARRSLFQYGERQVTRPHPRTKESPEEAVAFTRCIEALERIKKISGEVVFDPEAGELYDEWYAKNLLDAGCKPPTVKSWFMAKSDQVLKLCMLTALGEDESLIIKPAHLLKVLKLLSILEMDLTRVFGGAGINMQASIAQGIVDYVKSQTKLVPFSQIKAAFYQNLSGPDPIKTFTQIMHHLTTTEQIFCEIILVDNVPVQMAAISKEALTNFKNHAAAVQKAYDAQREITLDLPKPADPST